MCGIAGYVGTRELPTDRIEACLASLAHRGPDASGHRRHLTPDGRVVDLVHTRLAIIDLDHRADQPFVDGSVSLAYNGEIYNYLELRRELEALGERFRTASDTEVLARALARWGRDALDRLEGMWAFASYDARTGELMLCRDRFGEKPLYLHRAPDGLYFGSEPKAVFALLGRRLDPDRDHLRRFLVNGYKALHKGESTYYRGLERLPAAAALSIGPAGQTLARYWWPVVTPDAAMTPDEAVAGARERLARAVEVRLRADVPLAFCLSGGVDSVALASVARRMLGTDVHGFTIVNADARYDEEEMVDAAVADLGIRSTKVALSTEGFLPRLRELVRSHDAPVSTITYYVQWLLMGEIHDAGYKVSVTGTAADELFSGYYDHHLAYLYEVRRDPDLAPAAREAWSRHVRPLVRNPFLGDPDLFVRDPAFRDHVFLSADVFAGRLVEPFDEAFQETAYSADLLRNRMMNELLHEAVPVILNEDDLNAMSFSIENRSPFLDRALFEHCARIPTRHLVRDGRAKAILRDAVNGVAPEAVVQNRRKVGFNAPIEALLDMRDPGVRFELMADSPVFEIVRREPIAELLDRENLPNSESKFLFNFLGIKMFLEECVA
jgi:asparagine synthase (glutamine-hydrolysing)